MHSFLDLAVAIDQILSANVMTASTNPDLLASDFRQLVEISLWGNRGDLSLSAGTAEVTFYILCKKQCMKCNNKINCKIQIYVITA